MTDQTWHVAQDGQQVAGTHTTDEVVMLVQGSPASAFLVWRQGLDGWLAPKEVPELGVRLTPPNPTPPRAPESAPKPRVDTSSAAGTGSRPIDVHKGMGFVRSLFDLRFDNLVTPRMLSVLYGISMVLVALGLLAMLFSGLTSVVNGMRYSAWTMVLFGAVWVALSPILAILYLALIRMFFEIVVILFKIRDDLGAIARQGQDQPEA